MPCRVLSRVGLDPCRGCSWRRPEGEQPVLLWGREAPPCVAGRGTRAYGSKVPVKFHSSAAKSEQRAEHQHAVAPWEWGMAGWMFLAVMVLCAVLKYLPDLLVDIV